MGLDDDSPYTDEERKAIEEQAVGLIEFLGEEAERTFGCSIKDLDDPSDVFNKLGLDTESTFLFLIKFDELYAIDNATEMLSAMLQGDMDSARTIKVLPLVVMFANGILLGRALERGAKTPTDMKEKPDGAK